jgi:hypothetical protein
MIIANSTIVGGLAYYLNSLLESSSVPTYDGTWWLRSTGMYANPYMELGSNAFVLQASIIWKDPVPNLLNSIKEPTFRTAVQITLDFYPWAESGVQWQRNCNNLSVKLYTYGGCGGD